ncbi:hypothetical protein OAI07_01410 [Akkermansiaceae bacterium]|nr:hypothetical protein [Akkermansiaceae bacterium]
MTGTVNLAKAIKLESLTGLTDVVISITDSAAIVVSSGVMTEIIGGVYQFLFTSNQLGNYTISISSESLDLKTFSDLEIVEAGASASELASSIDGVSSDLNDSVQQSQVKARSRHRRR